MTADNILRHGAYICLRWRADGRAARTLPLEALAARLDLANEFAATSGHPDNAVSFLRRIDASAGTIEDAGLERADAVVHVASREASKPEAFCDEIVRLLEPIGECTVYRGVVRPTQYTGGAMNEFAYAHQRLQERGAAMPNAFLLPLKKSAAWWQKDWMERHTFFLPRYDGHGRMINDGHALAAAPGIRSLMRRTYQNRTMPAPGEEYDFVTYFECADADVGTFHAVRTALRNTSRNPEWAFVHEGPLWHGRRVESWADLFD